MIEELGRKLVDAEDDHEHTALMYVVQNANLKCVETLITNGADANIVLCNTCRFQSIPAVTIVTDVVSTLIDLTNLLHPKSHCSSRIMMEIFDVLVESVADVNKVCHHCQRTPIMYAAAVGNARCVKKLIYKGAALYTVDEVGHTVWTLAARIGNVDMLKCFMEDHEFY